MEFFFVINRNAFSNFFIRKIISSIDQLVFILDKGVIFMFESRDQINQK